MKSLLLTLLLTITCYAQKIDGKKIDKWDAIVTSIDGVTFSFAPESIRRNEDQITAWTRTDFRDGSGSIIPNTDYASIRILVDYDCAKTRARSRDILFYDLSGKVVKSGQDNDYFQEKPGTFGWAMFEYLCERRSQFPNQPPKLKP